MVLSKFTMQIWGKRGNASEVEVPLIEHLDRTADMAERIIDCWLPDGVRNRIDRKTLIFCAAVHDVGKATAHFQKGRHGHAIESQLILESIAREKSVDKKKYLGAATVIGAHHGKPQPNNDINKGISNDGHYFDKAHEMDYKKAWSEIVDRALDRAGMKDLNDLPELGQADQMLQCGALIMADWIASGNKDWDVLGFPEMWIPEYTPDIYCERFDFSYPNEMQQAVEKITTDIDKPGILIIEAPMGSGKTEAALAAAEIFSRKSGRKGIYFALPTQATSNAMFTRVEDWIRKLNGRNGMVAINLLHGKAAFNKDYNSLRVIDRGGDDQEDQSLMVHDWFEGRKTSMLADFGIGTIDQVLLAALKQKHVMLRHLGLANKVVIIDECHAYDAYMSEYLGRALNWLGAYEVPVVVLSATLPIERRNSIINAYCNKTIGLNEYSSANRSYPLLSWNGVSSIEQSPLVLSEHQKDVTLRRIEEKDITIELGSLLANGGCAGVIMNTVKRAQMLAKSLEEKFGKEIVNLIHSRFIICDRNLKENNILQGLGKKGNRPHKRIDVGTQVLEQSLDIDFDVLITEMAPADLLVQRIGRLHRHSRNDLNRPEPLKRACCLVINPDDGSKKIYGDYLLMRSQAIIDRYGSVIRIPVDIPDIVQDVYDEGVDLGLYGPEYEAAKRKHKELLAFKQDRASKFMLPKPSIIARRPKSIQGFLDTDIKDVDKAGQAAVRDGDESIEVIIVQMKNDEICFLEWVNDGRAIGRHMPDEETAKKMMECMVRLPPLLCYPDTISRTIGELESATSENVPEWHRSPWLQGEVVLILDNSGEVKISGKKLKYSREYGMEIIGKDEP
jgi:CRISPR-associated endonuclease/helicase Cas3